jgi:16S rRNA (uracil1498-N3)-methyltransferase
MQLYYHPHLQAELISIGNLVTLPEDESMHITKVLRHQIGDRLLVTDGKGLLMETQIHQLEKKVCTVEVLSLVQNQPSRSYQIHLAVAPTKNLDRFEWFLEKATEMGIDTITPIICDHSIRREIKIERSNRIISSAMKQSLQTFHPKLNEACTFKKFVNQSFDGLKLMAHLSEQSQKPLSYWVKKNQSVCILIGPEGDFSPEEVQLAVQNGYQLSLLGQQRLRTETAAIVACNQIHFINEDY